MLSGMFAKRKDFIVGPFVVESWSYELERYLTQRRRDAEYAEEFIAAFGRFRDRLRRESSHPLFFAVRN